ncbi:hypothetical protein JCM3775_004104 [Rhodotorula graminis]
MLGGAHEGSTAARLVRRALGDELQAASSAADSLLLRPLVPGLTTPLSLVPPLVAALVVAQGFHELGHALAAACEHIPLLSLHVRLFLLVLPTFAVALPSSGPSSPTSPATELRIAAAGIWHNVVLALAALAVSDQGGALGRRTGSALGVWEQIGEGVVVVSVSSSSPLAPHLVPGTTITHLDDLELDAAAHSVNSALELWRRELDRRRPERANDPYERLGWCVPAGRGSAWDVVPSGRVDGDEVCCASTNDAVPRVCFTARSPPASAAGAGAPVPLQACLDPLALVPPAPEPAPRCVDDASCGATASGTVCARIMTVTYLSPRYWFVSRSLPLSLEAFYSSLVSLSLALAFFNALPLPHLDGAHLVPAFLRALGSGSGGEAGLLPRLAPGREGRDDAAAGGSGTLERVLRKAGRTRAARWVVERREGVERGVRRWTVAVGGVTVVASGLVELLSWSAGR